MVANYTDPNQAGKLLCFAGALYTLGVKRTFVMIIITGMHRSGTSFTSNLLYELDMSFGEPKLLMEADQWNPKGYYENTEIHILNDQLILGDLAPIRKFRTTPSNKRSLLLRFVMTIFRSRYSLLDGKRMIPVRAARKQEEIKRLASVYAGVAVKDPRFSVTVGEWAKYVDIDRILYCYRHPYEVALSLQAHYHTPIWLGLRLWKTHVQEFFRQVQGLPVIMIHYGGYFSDRPLSEVKRLYRFAQRDYSDTGAQALLDQVLSHDLHRNMHRGQTLPSDITLLYESLNKLHSIYDNLKLFDGAVVQSEIESAAAQIYHPDPAAGTSSHTSHS